MGENMTAETAAAKSEHLAPGRIVHVVRYIEGVPAYAGCRPAIVVRTWQDGSFNGHLFLDGMNDTDNEGWVRWITSVPHHSQMAEYMAEHKLAAAHSEYEWHTHMECASLHNRGAL